MRYYPLYSHVIHKVVKLSPSLLSRMPVFVSFHDFLSLSSQLFLPVSDLLWASHSELAYVFKNQSVVPFSLCKKMLITFVSIYVQQNTPTFLKLGNAFCEISYETFIIKRPEGWFAPLGWTPPPPPPAKAKTTTTTTPITVVASPISCIDRY